jgi:hypothetical protein
MLMLPIEQVEKDNRDDPDQETRSSRNVEPREIWLEPYQQSRAPVEILPVSAIEESTYFSLSREFCNLLLDHSGRPIQSRESLGGKVESDLFFMLL